MIGRSLAHFEITAKLGEGGMGEVYRATDGKLGREVAIKVLPASFSADEERLARFEREARVLASLSHPNIAGIFEVGEQDGTHFLVMQLAEGETLARRIERGPVTVDEAIRIAIEIARGLEAAHARGIVHRDLKPANVMIDPGGQVKILDFGLAKAWADPPVADGSLSNSPTLTARMTGIGMILGTAAYMSPEQARGEEAEQRSDVWSWAVILWELLTGERLFGEATVSDTLAAVLRAEPDWDRLPAGASRAVRTVLRRALTRDPVNRLHAIADARIELTEPAEEPERPTETTSSRTSTAAWIAIAVLALAVAGWSWVTRSAPVEPPLRILEVGGGEDLEAAAISPDGKRVVMVRDDRLHVRELDSQTERELPDVEDVDSRFSLFWSPDSLQVGYTTPDELYRVGIDGGAPTRLCEIPDTDSSDGTVIGGTWWGSDGIVFSLGGAHGLLRVPIQGGEPTLVLAPDPEKGEFALHSPSVLPDGKTLVSRVFPRRGLDRTWDTFVFLRDGERTELTYPGWSLRMPVVTASGYLAFLRNDPNAADVEARQGAAGVWAVPFSIDDLRPNGEPVRILTGEFESLSISRDGTLLVGAARSSSSDAAIVDRSARAVGGFDLRSYFRDPAVSPDGRSLAFWRSGALYVYNGTRTIELAPRGGGPTWSPDAREIIYSDRERIFRTRADGSRPPVAISDRGGWGPHWSPKGDKLAFASQIPREEDAIPESSFGRRDMSQGDIFILDLEDGDERLLLGDPVVSEMYPRFSPDERFLAFASDATGRVEIYVTDFPAAERRWRISDGGGRFPRWSPAGDEIYWVSGSRLMAASFEAGGAGEDVEIGAPRPLLSTRQPGLAIRSFQEFGQTAYDVTPDGHFVVMRLTFEERGRAMLVQNWTKLLKPD